MLTGPCKVGWREERGISHSILILIGTEEWKTCRDDLTFLQRAAHTTEDWKRLGGGGVGVGGWLKGHGG